MGFWQILSYAAWGGSALFLLWIVVDLISVAKQYDEDFLMSAREGADELMEKKS